MTTYVYFGNNAADQAAFGVIPIGSEAAVQRSAFLEQLSTSRSESFETVVDQTRPTVAAPLLIFGSTATLTQLDAQLGNIQADKLPGSVFVGRFNTTPDVITGVIGDGKWWQTKGDFTVTFNTPTNAIGFYGTDFGDFGGTVLIDLYNGMTQVGADIEVGPDTGGQNGSLLFFGYIDTDNPFDTIVFKVTQAIGTPLGSEKLVGFDDFIVGAFADATFPYDGVGNFSNAPTTCITASPPEDVSSAYINVPEGFLNRWSTWASQHTATFDVFIEIYSELNGGGSMLASATLQTPRTQSPSSSVANAFYQTIVPFTGTAKSVRVWTSTGANFANRVFFDHMEFGTPPPLIDAPILTFGWSPINGYIRTSLNGNNDGAKFGIGFEELLTGPDAAPGTYADTSVGTFYQGTFSTSFTNATAVRSADTGGNGQFTALRHIDTDTGPTVDMGKVAIKLTTGQPRIIFNVPASISKSAFSMYYASTSTVVVRFYAVDDGAGSPSYIQTLPATGTCAIIGEPLYCVWRACRFEIDGGYKSVTITAADVNAVYDNITIGYPIPIVGSLAVVDNVIDGYYTGGTDVFATQGPTVPTPPPYPHPYGIEFTTGWMRSYYDYGPELAPDYFYKPGQNGFISNYGWTVLVNEAVTTQYINVVDGFIERVSFFLRSGTMQGIFSGLNGTGAQLALTTAQSRSQGGYVEYTFNGWARSIAFSSGAAVDALRIGPTSVTVYDAENVLPYMPAINVYTSVGSTSYTGTNRDIDRLAITVNPDGSITKGSYSVSTRPDHWLRDVYSGWALTGSLYVFSFDSAVNGQTEFANAGTYGGLYDTKSASISAVTGVSKWGTSSLRVAPNAAEPKFSVTWYDGFKLFDLVSARYASIEGWIRPIDGTSIPFNKTLVFCYGYGYYAPGKEWNSPDEHTGSLRSAAIYLYAYSSSTPGQVTLEMYVGQGYIGQVNVAAGQFHHAAILIDALSTASVTGSFYVNGARVATRTITGLSLNTGDTYGWPSITIGQSDRLGTFEYYLSDVRVSRSASSPTYSGATYTVPTAPFAAQTQINWPGSQYWVRARKVKSELQEDVNDNIVPYGWNSVDGEPINAWLRLDRPRQFVVDMAETLDLKCVLEIADDAAGTNIVGAWHGLGAKTLSIGQVERAFIGATTFVNNRDAFYTNGMLEPMYATGVIGYRTERNRLTNRLRTGTYKGEAFEGYTVGQSLPITAIFPADVGQLSCTVTGAGVIANTSATGQSNATPGGEKWIDASGPITFTFSQPICAFGVTVTDWGDDGTQTKLTVTDEAGESFDIVSQHSLALASGTRGFVGFFHPGVRYTSVTVGQVGAFGGISIDDLVIAQRGSSYMLFQTNADDFTSLSGSLSSNAPAFGQAWAEAFVGANSLVNLVPSGASSLVVDVGARGTTRYGGVISAATSADVDIIAEFTPGTFVADAEIGLIARKTGSSYYHLTYKLYPAGTLLNPRSNDYNVNMIVLTLTHQPSGDVIFSNEYTYNGAGAIKWRLKGNMHLISREGFLGVNASTVPGHLTDVGYGAVSIYDDRITTGGQVGFSIIQPTAASPWALEKFWVFEDEQPNRGAITYTFGETLASGGSITGQAKSARDNFLTALQAYSTVPFGAEVGQTAPFTAATYGASGVTVNITDLNGTTAAVASAADGKFNTSPAALGTAAFLTTGSTAVTFAPQYDNGLRTYYAEEAVPGGIVSTSSAPYLMRAKYNAAMAPGRKQDGVDGFTYPTSYNFDSATTGATSVNISFAGSYGYNTSTGLDGTLITCTLTGGLVANSASGGRFNTSGTGSKYWQATSGTETVFTFNCGISAFGAYLTDIGDVEGTLTCYLLPDDGTAEVSFVVRAAGAVVSGNLAFFGFTDMEKRYTRIRLVCDAPVDSYGIDDVTCADFLMVGRPIPYRAFGVFLTDAANSATTYSASIVTSAGTTNVAIPLTQSQANSGLAFWGFTLNDGSTLTSVTITGTNAADMPGFDDVIFGAPWMT